MSVSPCSIENEYGLRAISWIGPALASLDFSRNGWLATHHAYGLLGGAAARVTALKSLCLADCPRLQVRSGPPSEKPSQLVVKQLRHVLQDLQASVPWVTAMFSVSQIAIDSLLTVIHHIFVTSPFLITEPAVRGRADDADQAGRQQDRDFWRLPRLRRQALPPPHVRGSKLLHLH